MIINDYSTDPIIKRLKYLKEVRLFVNPKQFTIDCYKAKVYAIISNFNPAVTKIQYCVFHIIHPICFYN
jgi:hypothetical protein